MKNIVKSFIVILFLFGCKTITITDEQIIAEIPESIELITIPAGAYTSGDNNIEKFIYYDYEMMKYPVTNAQYMNFIKQARALDLIEVDSLGVYGQYSGDEFWSPGKYKYIDFEDKFSRNGFYSPDYFFTRWRYVSNKKEGYDNHPVTHVTWFGAYAFAKFYGMRLPITTEWEKAARGNSIRDYPWGYVLSPSFANYKDSGDEYDNDTTPVWYYNGQNNTKDSYSPYGIYDLAGNTWEWVDSWWRDSSGRIIKGGSWNSFTDFELMAWYEPGVGYLPHNFNREIGFRCVKDISK